MEKDWKQLQENKKNCNINNDVNIGIYLSNILKFGEKIENITNALNTAIEKNLAIESAFKKFLNDKIGDQLVSSRGDIWISFILLKKIVYCPASKTGELFEFETMTMPRKKDRKKQQRSVREPITLKYNFMHALKVIIGILDKKIDPNDTETTKDEVVEIYQNIFKCIKYLLNVLFGKIKFPMTLSGMFSRNGKLAQDLLTSIEWFIKKFVNVQKSNNKNWRLKYEKFYDELVAMQARIDKLKANIKFSVGNEESSEERKSIDSNDRKGFKVRSQEARDSVTIATAMTDQGRRARKSIEISGFAKMTANKNENETKENDSITVSSDKTEESSVNDINNIGKAPPGYELIGSLGAGGCASVDAVFNKNNGKIYASKRMSKWMYTQDGKRTRVRSIYHKEMVRRESSYYREFEKNQCKYLVNMHEKLQDDENYYIVLDYYKHGDLYNYLSNNKSRFDEEWLKKLMAMIVFGIAESHLSAVVNLDIKNENIFVTNDGKIVVADFGIARTKYQCETLNLMVGTMFAVSPEMLNYDPIGTHCDWWGLGVLMFMICYDCFPFPKLDQLSFHQVANWDESFTFSQNNYFNEDYKNIEKRQGCNSRLTEKLSDDGWDFMTQLLKFDPEDRLGTTIHLQVMKHKWFKGFDWTKLSKKEISLFD